MRFALIVVCLILTGCSTSYTTSVSEKPGKTVNLEFTKTPAEVMVTTQSRTMVKDRPDQITLNNVQSDSVRVYVPGVNRQSAVVKTYPVNQDTNRIVSVPGNSANYLLLSMWAGIGAGLLPVVLIL